MTVLQPGEPFGLFAFIKYLSMPYVLSVCITTLVSLKAQGSLQTVLTSRFLINLRRTQLPPDISHSSDIRLRSPVFRLPPLPSIVEDMGRPLDHGLRDHDAEIDEDSEEASDTASPVRDGLSWAGG